MKIDKLEKFKMLTPIELNKVCPIAVVVGKACVGKTEFIRQLCMTDFSSNIIYYDEKGLDLSTIVGETVRFEGKEIEEIFSKINEIIQIQLSTGLSIETLVILDDVTFSASDYRDAFLRLISDCLQFNIRLLFTQQHANSVINTIISDSGVSANYYQIVRDANKSDIRFITFLNGRNYIVLNNETPHIWTRSYDCPDDNTFFIEPSFTDGELSLTRIEPIRCVADTALQEINERTMSMKLGDKITRKAPKLYIINADYNSDDTHPSLYKCLVLGQTLRCYFILIADQLPTELKNLCIENTITY